MRFFSLFLLFVLVLSSLVQGQESNLPARVESALSYSDIPHSSVSLIVQPLSYGQEAIVNLNPNTPRNPASTIKVLTTYAALEVLGPGYRWPTEIYLRGPLENGVLKGDLGIKGYGDPFMALEDMWKMLRELKRIGVRKIEGDLIFDDSYFAETNEDMGEFDGQPSRTYNLLPNALLANFQTVRFIFNDDGKDVRLDMLPDLPNLKVENRLRSSHGACIGYNAGIAIQISNLPDRDVVQLDGKHPDGCEDYGLSRTVLQADSYFFGLFKSLWEEMGGEISGNYRNEDLVIRVNEEPYMQWLSRPFREILTSTNKFSNNTMTRHLLLTLAAEEKSIPAMAEDGIEVIDAFLTERGIDTSQMQMQNGSGLSRDVRLDAQLLADTLIDAYQSPNAAEFVASLPINGVDGTMRNRLNGERSAGMAHIKTGRMDDVVSLAGIVQSKSGQRYVLVFIVNHEDVHRGIGNDIGDVLIDWLYNY